MPGNRLSAAICLGTSLLVLPPQTAIAEVYPSAQTAWILPGGWQTPGDAAIQAQYPDAAAVKQWEVEHADLALGADYGSALNQQIDAIAYIYNQKLEFDPPLNQSLPKEIYLRRGARQAGLDYEDFFLHLSEDSWLAIDNPTHAADTSFNQRPLLVGYTANSLHAGYWLYQQPPWGVNAWQHASQGGAVYVYQFERFDQLHIDLASGASDGQLLVEYPASIDAQGQVQQWQVLTLHQDSTADLRQSGLLRFDPPNDWQMAATHDGSGQSYGHGQFFNSQLLRDQARMYVLRLRWVGGSGAGPVLDDIRLRRWQLDGAGGQRMIPGWDAANDSDGNGYVDDQEFANRANAQASARFRHEARAVPLGRMWSASSSWCTANLYNPQLRDLLANYYQVQWQQKQLGGGYNDDLFKTVGPLQYQISQGGSISERNWSLQSQAAYDDYNGAMMLALERIRQVTGVRWIGGNTAARNPFIDASAYPFTQGLSLFLREDYLHASTGLAGYTGLARTWDTSALAALQLHALLQVSSRYGRNRLISNNEAHWQTDLEAMLAQYHLVQHGGFTALHSWYHAYNYGSGNTYSWTYWKPGVPNNMAYQPSAMLSVDIGRPSGQIPDGYAAMPLISHTSDGDYTLIGDSSSTRLIHPDLLPNGELQVEPTQVFYLHRSADHPNVPGLPQEMILAREFTDGLVLYRTDFIGGQRSFMDTLSAPVDLPGRYQRVLADGSLGPSIRQIQLKGYEGALLKRDPTLLEQLTETLQQTGD